MFQLLGYVFFFPPPVTFKPCNATTVLVFLGPSIVHIVDAQ